METERKDRSFLGRLRDYFTLTGLAKHLKENRDFARVGEEDRNGVEGMKSLQLREKWQQGPNKPNSSTNHDGTCCNNTDDALVAVLLPNLHQFLLKPIFSPSPSSSSRTSCPPSVILHLGFRSLSIVGTRPSAALASTQPEGRRLIMRYQSRV